MTSSGAYRFPSDPVSFVPPEVPQYQDEPLPLMSATSREDGYNPSRVFISGQVRERFDPHPEVDPIMLAFYSPENVRLIQDALRRAGLGTPRPWSLKPYMDQAIRYERGVYNPNCVPDYAGAIRRQIETLNHRVVHMVRPIMEATKFGFEQYYRDINMRRLPEYPHMQPPAEDRGSDGVLHPYYYSLQ